MIDDKALEAAVLAYDDARRASHGHNEPAMSERNRKTIAPMISAAITAYLQALGPTDTAPAEMPGEEEIGRLLMKQFYDQWYAPHRPAYQGSVYWDYVNGSSAWAPSARAILALFAPILAEKEREVAVWQAEVRREGDRFKGEVRDLNAECDRLEARALAAEAALDPFARMDETEFVGSIYEHADDDMVVLFNHATGVKIHRGDFRRASAIRAGE